MIISFVHLFYLTSQYWLVLQRTPLSVILAFEYFTLNFGFNNESQIAREILEPAILVLTNICYFLILISQFILNLKPLTQGPP